jgi:DNA-binding NarL/FixJ family response regulator
MAKKMATAPTAKVLIVDDHPAVREALRIRIAMQPDLELCGEAADVAEAVRLVEETAPDVAVIDIGLKTGSGIDLIKRLKAHHAPLRMVVWSMYGEDLYAERALRAGAMGYLTKEQATGSIIDAIRQVLQGKMYLSPTMTERFVKRAVGRSGPEATLSPAAVLSDRELEVFRLIGEGQKTQAVAAALHLSVKTVETYRGRIRAKLNLSDGMHLTRCAVQWLLENG